MMILAKTSHIHWPKFEQQDKMTKKVEKLFPMCPRLFHIITSLLFSTFLIQTNSNLCN
jgi:hypothetical protein